MIHQPEHATQQPAGIYVHVPFCIKKCNYCDFYSITDTRLMEACMQGVEEEIRLSAPRPYVFNSIYFGGGTPSLLEPTMVDRILKTLFDRFQIIKQPEITLEANPKTITTDKLYAFKASGINRIHLGVQSFSDPNLHFLGRVHSSEDVVESIHKIREAGFDNMGMDLIYGLPGQTQQSWISDLSRAVFLDPEHLSCYMLTYEPGTPLEGYRQNGAFEPLSEENTAVLFETTRIFLAQKGFFQYEISNFAKIRETPEGGKDYSAYRSLHNGKYWTFAPYLGFGPSAHSFETPLRYWNIGDVHHYIDLVNSGVLPVEEQEVLTRDQQIIEAISLGLRTREGIAIRRFEAAFEMPFIPTFKPALIRLKNQGMVMVSTHRLRLTPKGMLLLNSIVEMLVDCL